MVCLQEGTLSVGVVQKARFDVVEVQLLEELYQEELWLGFEVEFEQKLENVYLLLLERLGLMPQVVEQCGIQGEQPLQDVLEQLELERLPPERIVWVAR